jgi:hypothetical protein
MRRPPNLEFGQFKAQGSSAQGDPPQVRAPKLAAFVLGTKALKRTPTIDCFSTTAPIPD